MQNSKMDKINVSRRFFPILLGFVMIIGMIPAHITLKAAGDASISGSDYVTGNAHISGLTLRQENNNYTVPNNSTVSLLVTTGFALNPDSQYTGFTTATVNYEFIVRRYFSGSSGGNVSFNSSDYSWLSNVKVGVVNIDGVQYWKLTGTRALVAPQLIPGQSQETITVRVGDAKNGDTFTVSGRAWLNLDGEATVFSAASNAFTVSAAIDGKYDLYCRSANNGAPVISGYYNPTTQAFYTTEAAKNLAGDTAAVYGRFFYFGTEFVVKNYATVGAEPLKTAAWDMQYAVTVDNSGSKTTLPASDPYAPILVDVKPALTTTSNTGFINGADLTMGGNVAINADSSAYTSATSTKYTGSDSNGTASIAVDLSPAPGWGGGTRSLFFVPTDPSDTSTTKRTLTVTLANSNFTGISGLTGNDAVPTNNTYTYIVPPKVDGGGAGIGQSFPNGSSILAAGGTYGIVTNLTYPAASLANTEITAANILVKLDTSGLSFTGNYSTDTFGGNATVKRLFACKPDGTAWTDDAEMFITRAAGLVYYDSLSNVPSGWKVVGLLYEFRNGLLSDNDFRISSGVKANNTGSYAMALDSETWFSSNDNTVTYSGTNGGALSTVNPPSQNIYSSDGGTYIKTQWANGTISTQDPNKSKYGCTYKVSGYVMLNGSASILNGTNPRDPVPSVAENGGSSGASNYSTFNVSDGNRLMAASGTFAVFWNGSGDDPKTPMRLKISRFSGTSLFQQVGNVYMAPADAKVTWNEKSKSFESSDSRFKQINPADFTLTGAGQYIFYYNLHIGDETDLSKDVSTGTYTLGFGITRYLETTEILQMPNTRYDVNYYGERACNITPVIAKSSVVGLAKEPLDTVVAPGEDVGYSLASSSLKAIIPNYSMLDVLPFNNDNRGSVINGNYRLTNNGVSMILSTSEPMIGSSFAIYYTTDPAVRTAGNDGAIPNASEVDATTFDPSSTLGITWKEMTKTIDTGNSTVKKTVVNYFVQVADINTAPTAIIMVGTFGKNEQFYTTMKFETTDNHYENVYSNNASIDSPDFLNHPIYSATSSVEVVHKTIEGIAWVDANHNGAIDSDETKFSGITVHLHKADGNEVTQDAYGDAYGTVTTDADGYYSFKNMNDNTDGWYVTFDLTLQQQHDYSLTTYHASAVADNANSDFLKSASTGTTDATNLTPIFTMPSYSMQADNNQLSAQITNDFGLVPNNTVTWEAVAGGSIAAGKTAEQVAYNDHPANDVTVNGTTGQSEFNGIWNIETYDAVANTWISAGTTTDYKSLVITVPTKLIAQLRTFQSIAIAGTKTLTGDGKSTAGIEANQFSFKVIRTDSEKGNVTGLPTIAIFTFAGGALDFESWTFEAAGTYTFTISENNVPAGYTKATEVTVTVAISLNAAGTAYDAKVTYSSGDILTFANSYTSPDAVTVPITGAKTLTGEGKTSADIKENQFSFMVTTDGKNPENSVTGLPDGSVGTAAGGALDFGTWSFSKTGTYKFTIAENPVPEGYTKGADVIVTVEIGLDEATNKFTKTVTYSNGDELTFENKYTSPDAVTVPITGAKTLTGEGKTSADIKENQFNFSVAANADNPENGVTGLPDGSVGTATGGALDFGTWSFSKTGTYKFTIAENPVPEGYTKGSDVIVTVEIGLDEATNKFTRTVAYSSGDDLTFENKYTGSKTPNYTSLNVRKVWVGSNTDTASADVQVQLYRNGAAFGEAATLNAMNDWTMAWNQLDGNYEWSVDELNVPDGYTKQVDHAGRNWTITNTRTKVNSPLTNDSNNLLIWLIVLVLSVGSAVIILIKMRKHSAK